MRVSINEREEVGNVSGQTKYFLQGTVDECKTILNLLETQSYDRASEERRLEALDGKVIELDCTHLGERPAAGVREGGTPIELTAGDALGGFDIQRLLSAVSAVYYAGWWLCDRPCDSKDLWTELRDAAGFEHGLATQMLGPNNHHATGLPKNAGEPNLFYELRDFFGKVLGSDPETVVDRATAHLTAKMFMARWRYRLGQEPMQGDAYYRDCLSRRVLPTERRVADEGRLQAAE